MESPKLETNKEAVSEKLEALKEKLAKVAKHERRLVVQIRHRAEETGYRDSTAYGISFQPNEFGSMISFYAPNEKGVTEEFYSVDLELKIFKKVGSEEEFTINIPEV